MRGPNNSFWFALAICMVATIAGSSGFTVLPPSTTTTRTACPLLLLNNPKTSMHFYEIGMRSRYRQPQYLHSALHMIFGGGGMEIGILTAQLLLDKRRHAELKQNMRKNYPFVPDSVLDICIDITAKAFTTVAPEKIRKALQPGALQQAQPELKKALVRAALDQRVIQNIPVFKNKDKEALLGNVVDLALRFVLKDAQAVLAAPEVRLQALEEQVRRVQAQMGPWRLALYRLRNNPLQVATRLIVALSVVLLFAKRNDPTVVSARRAFSKLVVLLLTLVQKEIAWMFLYSKSKVMNLLLLL